VAECQKRLNLLTPQEAALHRQLEEPQSRQLLKNTHFINGLINDRRFSLADLVADITHLMPPDVCLTGLATAPDGEQVWIRFMVTAKTEGAIEAFLNNLEDSPRFQEVQILNQGFEQRGSNPELENISCTARYLILKHDSSGK
jgi:hypothetical protein